MTNIPSEAGAELTPEFLRTPGLHLVRIGTVARYVAQDDDQPVGVKAGEEFSVLRHKRHQAALPLTDAQTQLLRDLDPSKPFDANLLTQDEAVFFVTLLKEGALVPVLFTPEALPGANDLAQLDFVPVLRQSMQAKAVGEDGYVLRVVENLTDEQAAAGASPVPVEGAPEITIGVAEMDVLGTHIELSEALEAAAGPSAYTSGVTLAEAAQRSLEELRERTFLPGEFPEDAARAGVLRASLGLVRALGAYGGFSFEVREELTA